MDETRSVDTSVSGWALEHHYLLLFTKCLTHHIICLFRCVLLLIFNCSYLPNVLLIRLSSVSDVSQALNSLWGEPTHQTSDTRGFLSTLLPLRASSTSFGHSAGFTDGASSLPCSVIPPGREINEALTMMGPRQWPRDSVSSTLCCCVFLNYHPFKGITLAPKVLCKNALLFFSPLWQTGAIHPVSEAWIHSSAAKAPGVFSHSVLTKLLTCCWRRCSPNHGPNNPEKVREPITGWGVRGCLWSWITLSIPTGTPGDAPKQFPPHLAEPLTGTHQTGTSQCGHQWGAKSHQLWDISHLISAFPVFFTSHGFEFVIKAKSGHKNGS